MVIAYGMNGNSLLVEWPKLMAIAYEVNDNSLWDE
jgi:hypothetical protein